MDIDADDIRGMKGAYIEENGDVILENGIEYTINDANCEVSPYADWNFDFIVSFSKSLDSFESYKNSGGKTVILVGNYAPYGWIPIGLPTTVTAGQEIPLLSSAGKTINYVELNENVKDFLCGALYTGSDELTMTIKFVAYGVDEKGDDQTYVIDEYSYMFESTKVARVGDNEYETFDAAVSVAEGKQTIELLKDIGDYTMSVNQTLIVKAGGFSINITAPEGNYAVEQTSTEDGVTTYTVVSPYVATIGTQGYTTVAAAITAAQPGETVVLLADVTENVTVAAGKSITVDLNGHTITHKDGADVYASAIQVNGNLTLKDSVGTGKITGNAYVDEHYWNGLINVASGASFTMESGKIEPTGGYEGSAITVYGTANVTGGTITGNAYNGLVYVKENGSFTLNGGTIKDTQYTANNQPRAITGASGSTINITSGLIENCSVGTTSAGNNGGAISSKGAVNISGGTIRNCSGLYAGAVSIGTTGTLSFTGGTIKDCSAQYGGGISVNGTATISGTASISGCTAKDASTEGSALFVAGTVTMTGGTISGKNSGAVKVNSTGTFNFNGGTITNESGRGVHTDGTFTMDGGTNTAAFGGAYIERLPITGL